MESDSLNKLIIEIYQATENEDYMSHIFKTIVERANASSGGLMIVDDKNQECKIVQGHNIEQKTFDSYHQYYHTIDSPAFFAINSPNVALHTTSLFKQNPETYNPEFEEGFIKANSNVHHRLGIAINTPDINGCIVLYRDLYDGDFINATKTKILLETIQPHFLQAARIASRFQQSEKIVAAYSELNKQLHNAIVMYDNKGNVIFASEHLMQLIAPFPPIIWTGNSFKFKDVRLSNYFHRTLNNIINKEKGHRTIPSVGGSLHLTSPTLNSWLRVRIFPYDSKRGEKEICAIVKISLISQNLGGSGGDVLRDLFGMTNAEIKLSQSLLAGLSVNEYAVANQLAVATIRAQMRSLFQKTGVARQPDLIRLLMSFMTR